MRPTIPDEKNYNVQKCCFVKPSSGDGHFQIRAYESSSGTFPERFSNEHLKMLRIKPLVSGDMELNALLG